MRVRRLAPVAVLSLGAVSCGACERAAAPAPQPPPAAAPWMVKFDASKDVRIGIEVADLRAWFDGTHRGEMRKTYGKAPFEKMWNEMFLLQTPAWKLPELPAFSLSRYEVTNAQWARFLASRQEAIGTKGDETLRGIVMQVWRTSNDGRSEAEINRGVKTLVVANWAALQPTLDPRAGPE